MEIRALRKKVLVKRNIVTEHKRNGIIIPDIAKANLGMEGEVINVGKDCTEGLQVGDRVLIGKWIGKEIEQRDGNIVSIKEDDIFAKIEEK